MIKVDIRNGMLAVACPFSQTFLSFAHMRGSPSFIVGESRLRQAEHFSGLLQRPFSRFPFSTQPFAQHGHSQHLITSIISKFPKL